MKNWMHSLVQVMPITHILRSTVLKLAAAVDAVVLVKLLVCECLDSANPGRVAAGALAERYLKQAYNIEIVAFVSSVGKIQLPFFSEGDEEMPLNEDYIQLLRTVTREDVDKENVRCPNHEVADRMREVRPFQQC